MKVADVEAGTGQSLHVAARNRQTAIKSQRDLQERASSPAPPASLLPPLQGLRNRHFDLVLGHLGAALAELGVAQVRRHSGRPRRSASTCHSHQRPARATLHPA